MKKILCIVILIVFGLVSYVCAQGPDQNPVWVKTSIETIVTPAQINVTGSATTTQTPATHSTFTGWSGTCGCTGTGSCAPMITAACTIIATWSADSQYLLLVTYPLRGEIVVADSETILCGGGNLLCSDTYYTGTTVTLSTACPLSASKTIYDGDCTGSSCSLAMDVIHSVGVACISGVTHGGVTMRGGTW